MVDNRQDVASVISKPASHRPRLPSIQLVLKEELVERPRCGLNGVVHCLCGRRPKELLHLFSPWANSKIPTFHFLPREGRFDFINCFILPRITGNRLLGGEKVVECCVLDESLKHLSLPWQRMLSSRSNAFSWSYSNSVL